MDSECPTAKDAVTFIIERSSLRVPRRVPITRMVSGGRRVEWSRIESRAVGARVTERGAVVWGREDVGGRGRERWRNDGGLAAVDAMLPALVNSGSDCPSRLQLSVWRSSRLDR